VERRSGNQGNVLLVKPEDVAGWQTPVGYFQVGYDGKQYMAHSIVDFLFNGDMPTGLIVDHKDGNYSNTKKSNLRRTTRAVNQRNQKLFSTNTSGMCGVTSYEAVPGYKVWTAKVFDLNRQKLTKTFSVPKYGEEVAFKMACAWREDMINKLNTDGAQYSERHGKSKE